MKQDDVDTLTWVAGLAILATGCGIQWGWPASLICLGAIFTIWPLVKAGLKFLR